MKLDNSRLGVRAGGCFKHPCAWSFAYVANKVTGIDSPSPPMTLIFLMKSIISSLGLPFLYIETFGRFCLLLPDGSFFGCAFLTEAWNLQYLPNAVSSFAKS